MQSSTSQRLSYKHIADTSHARQLPYRRASRWIPQLCHSPLSLRKPQQSHGTENNDRPFWKGPDLHPFIKDSPPFRCLGHEFSEPWYRPHHEPMELELDTLKSLKNYLQRQCKHLASTDGLELPERLKETKYEYELAWRRRKGLTIHRKLLHYELNILIPRRQQRRAHLHLQSCQEGARPLQSVEQRFQTESSTADTSDDHSKRASKAGIQRQHATIQTQHSTNAPASLKRKTSEAHPLNAQENLSSKRFKGTASSSRARGPSVHRLTDSGAEEERRFNAQVRSELNAREPSSSKDGRHQPRYDEE